VVICILILAIPLIALANSRKANLNTKTKEVIYQVTVKTKAEPLKFPVGEYSKVTVAEPTLTQVLRPIPKIPKIPANSYKLFIYTMESGNRTNAVNAYSGACGLGQSLPCSKMGCSLTDYACQDAWFTNYAISRYGSWYNAYCFWVGHRWW
jgi:hypothetical protein